MKRVLLLFFVGALFAAAKAQQIVSEEPDNGGGRVVCYSDGTSKVFDQDNNWIQFKTEYETNIYTGEKTNKPQSIHNYLPDIIAANIIDKSGYSIVLNQDREITIETSTGVSYIFDCKQGITFSVFLQMFKNKKKNKAFVERLYKKGGAITTETVAATGNFLIIKMPSNNIWCFDIRGVLTDEELNKDSKAYVCNRIDNYNRELLEKLGVKKNAPLHPSYNEQLLRLIGVESYIKDNGFHVEFEIKPNFIYVFSDSDGINEKTYYSFFGNRSKSINEFLRYLLDLNGLIGIPYIVRGPNGNELINKDDVEYKLLSGWPIKGGFLDESTNRMYYPNIGLVMPLYSNSANISGSHSLRSNQHNNDELLVCCLPTDTISKLVINENVGEIYLTSGDYLKYSKLRGGIVYDCYLHRKDGILMVTSEDNKISSKYIFTDGKYEGFVYEDCGSQYYDFVLAGEEVHFPKSVYEAKTDKDYEDFCNGYEEESVTLEMVPYVSAADEMEQKQKEKQNKIQQLYKKYGKRYVDAMYNQGKILIGCPEGLILSGVSVWYSLRHESQYQKFYSVTVEPNAMLPKTMKVWVDKRTKKVTSVSY